MAPAMQITRELSQQENQICALVVQGKPNKATAAELKISPGTVSEVLRRIYLKTGCNGRTALAVRWVQGASAHHKPTRANQKPKPTPAEGRRALRGSKTL
jgi:DNA-binding CsgD family transcriptional regulator